MKNLKPVTSVNPVAESEPNKPSVLTGDSIYYKHPETGAPHHGIVAGIGKHGMLVDADGGGEHQVEWSGYIAHRARSERKLTIVDRGEDGSIMEDENGKRVFVKGKLEDYEEQQLEKSLVNTPISTEENQLAEQVRGVELLLENLLRSQATMSANVVAALTQLKESQNTQFQGLCTAISIMSAKDGDGAAMQQAVQQALIAALTESRKPQDVTIHMPETAPPIVNITIPHKKTVTELERDRDGNLTRAVQTEINQ